MCRIVCISLLNCSTSALRSSVPVAETGVGAGFRFEKDDTADSLCMEMCPRERPKASLCFRDIPGVAAPGGRVAGATSGGD